MTAPAERRKHPRHCAEIQCKVRCPRTGRYLSAVTTDQSPGGLLLTVQTPLALAEGQEIAVALPHENDAVIRASDLLSARVVRSSAVLDRHQVVAVQFENAGAASASEPQTAAA